MEQSYTDLDTALGPYGGLDFIHFDHPPEYGHWSDLKNLIDWTQKPKAAGGLGAIGGLMYFAGSPTDEAYFHDIGVTGKYANAHGAGSLPQQHELISWQTDPTYTQSIPSHELSETATGSSFPMTRDLLDLSSDVLGDNQVPTGNFGSQVQGSDYAAGWVKDPDTVDQPSGVQIYMDGPVGSPNAVNLGKYSANIDRGGDIGVHGFRVQLPSASSGTHWLYAYALDSFTGNRTLISPTGGRLYTW
jgi:hypothetical protein